jgi:hypothetical protein
MPGLVGCYALNPVGVRSRSWSGVCVGLDLASAYVLRPYVTICPNLLEYHSLGRRWTRTRDSGEIQDSNWVISPQLAGLKYINWSTKRGTYSKGDQA